MKRINWPDGNNFDALINFIFDNPFNVNLTADLIKMFFNDLSSSHELIFDIYDDRGRLAVGILLDRVNNPANDACLEILAVRADADLRQVFLLIIKEAACKKPQHRSGIQIAFKDSLATFADDLKNLGWKHFYDTFDMVNSKIMPVRINTKFNINFATEQKKDELFNLICDTFSENLETSVPNETQWKQNFLKSTQSNYFVVQENDILIGFAHLILNVKKGESEVRTLGVSKEHRSRGIGTVLLGYCLNESFQNRLTRCQLSVAVENKNALGIYVKLGFVVNSTYKCFRKVL